MAVTLSKPAEMDLISKIKNVADMCKISNFEDLVYSFFDNLSDDNPVNYVGELNKNDVMH